MTVLFKQGSSNSYKWEISSQQPEVSHSILAIGYNIANIEVLVAALLAKGVVDFLSIDDVVPDRDVCCALGANKGAAAVRAGVNCVDWDFVAEVLETNLVDGVVAAVTDGADGDVAAFGTYDVFAMGSGESKLVKLNVLQV